MNHSHIVSQLQEFQQTSPRTKCPRCHQKQEVYLELQCGHQFCIICIIYIYLKYKNQLKNPSQIQCLNCHKISQLDEPSIQLINQTIKKQIIPFVKKGQQYQSRITPAQFNQKFQKKNIKSQDSSFIGEQKTQNAIGNIFFSKSGSPYSKIYENNAYCKVHPSDQLEYVCMSCQMKLLCLRCITSKIHSSHDIKGLRKAYQIINQEINLLKINSVENIQNAELFLRRLGDRNQLLKQRSNKQINQVKQSFQHIIKKLVQKQQQIICSYEQCFKYMFDKIQLQIAKANQFLTSLKQYKLNIQTNEKSTPNSNMKLIQIICQHENLKTWRKKIDSKDISSQILNKYQKMLDPLNFHHQSLTKSISLIADHIDSINSQKIKQQFFQEVVKQANLKKDLFCKNKSQAMRNCSSREKLKKDQFKRIKTNIASLNSSREKKEKKCTKTQEDERRLKSKANYKTQTNNSTKMKTSQFNSNIPSYIIKNIQKGKTPTPFNIPTYMESQQKNNSKILSKSNKQFYKF